MEIDEVVVDSALLARARGGDTSAVAAIRSAVDGLVLYSHCLAGVPGDVVTIKELEGLGVLGHITLSIEP